MLSSSVISSFQAINQLELSHQHRLLFESIDERGDGYITARSFSRTLQESGITIHDARLHQVKQKIFQYGDEHINFQQFREAIQPNAELIERALKHQLVIPDWNTFTSTLTSLFHRAKQLTNGKVANYIPELARANPNHFGLTFCSCDGQMFSIGDAKQEFSIQSSSKPLSYLIALEEHGEEYVHRFVGREASGRNFNELCLNTDSIPHNPMINSGAIMICSLIKNHLDQSDRFSHIMNYYRQLTGQQTSTNKQSSSSAYSSAAVTPHHHNHHHHHAPAPASNSPTSDLLDDDFDTTASSNSTDSGSSGTAIGSYSRVQFSNSTYLSERASADRNFCLAFMMQELQAFQYGRYKQLQPRKWGPHDLVKNLELYFQCCSILTNTQGQAVIAATLANGGICPLTTQQCFQTKYVRNAMSLMLSCGMYDFSGEWAYKIGMPAKSGVSGCIFVLVPGIGGFSLYSPALDEIGNSVRGIGFCRLLVETFGFHYYDSISLSGSSKQNPCDSKSLRSHQDFTSCCYLAHRGDVQGKRSEKEFDSQLK